MELNGYERGKSQIRTATFRFESLRSLLTQNSNLDTCEILQNLVFHLVLCEQIFLIAFNSRQMRRISEFPKRCFLKYFYVLPQPTHTSTKVVDSF